MEALETLKNYAEGHNNEIFEPYLGKQLKPQIFLDAKTNSASPSPMICRESENFKIICENTEFERVSTEEEAFFCWIAFHFRFNLEFIAGVEKKIKTFIKKYFK